MKKIIFFGLGSIGLRHVRILERRKDVELFAFRTRKGQRQIPTGINEVERWADVDRIKPDIAFITNPTALHINTAIQCAKRGMHLFIEKPIGHQVKDLQKLLRIVAQQKRSAYVAYVLRFHPMIQRLKKELERNRLLHLRILTTSYLPSWRSGQDHLKGYSALKRMGGGVINDLSHELDLVWYLLGDFKQMKGHFDRRSGVTVDAEDYADICIQTSKGPANVHINFLSQLNQRILQIDLKDKAIVVDLTKNTWEEYKQGRLMKKTAYCRILDDCFNEQIDYFLKNLHRQRMMNNIFDAVPLFKQIDQFKKRR